MSVGDRARRLQGAGRIRLQVRNFPMSPWWHEAMEMALAAQEKRRAELDPEVREMVEAIGEKLDADVDWRFLDGPSSN